MKRNILNIIGIGLMFALTFASCVEHRYYHKNNKHSNRYKQHKYKQGPPPHANVQLNIHN